MVELPGNAGHADPLLSTRALRLVRRVDVAYRHFVAAGSTSRPAAAALSRLVDGAPERLGAHERCGYPVRESRPTSVYHHTTVLRRLECDRAKGV